MKNAKYEILRHSEEYHVQEFTVELVNYCERSVQCSISQAFAYKFQHKMYVS